MTSDPRSPPLELFRPTDAAPTHDARLDTVRHYVADLPASSFEPFVLAMRSRIVRAAEGLSLAPIPEEVLEWGSALGSPEGHIDAYNSAVTSLQSTPPSNDTLGAGNIGGTGGVGAGGSGGGSGEVVVRGGLGGGGSGSGHSGPVTPEGMMSMLSSLVEKHTAANMALFKALEVQAKAIEHLCRPPFAPGTWAARLWSWLTGYSAS